MKLKDILFEAIESRNRYLEAAKKKSSSKKEDNKKELELMSQIEEYQSLDVEKIEQGKTFTKYERSDPFFTP